MSSTEKRCAPSGSCLPAPLAAGLFDQRQHCSQAAAEEPTRRLRLGRTPQPGRRTKPFGVERQSPTRTDGRGPTYGAHRGDRNESIERTGRSRREAPRLPPHPLAGSRPHLRSIIVDAEEPMIGVGACSRCASDGEPTRASLSAPMRRRRQRPRVVVCVSDYPYVSIIARSGLQNGRYARSASEIDACVVRPSGAC